MRRSWQVAICSVLIASLVFPLTVMTQTRTLTPANPEIATRFSMRPPSAVFQITKETFQACSAPGRAMSCYRMAQRSSCTECRLSTAAPYLLRLSAPATYSMRSMASFLRP